MYELMGEIDKVLFFKDVYTKEGIEITVEQTEKLLESKDLKDQIIETIREKNPEIKVILKSSLPYFMYVLIPKLSEEAKQGFFTDNMIIGCSFDYSCYEYFQRIDNVLEQEARAAIQSVDRDTVRTKSLPGFNYPEYIKDPFSFVSVSNNRYKSPLK